jgi:hypothetical protein
MNRNKVDVCLVRISLGDEACQKGNDFAVLLDGKTRWLKINKENPSTGSKSAWTRRQNTRYFHLLARRSLRRRSSGRAGSLWYQPRLAIAACAVYDYRSSR